MPSMYRFFRTFVIMSVWLPGGVLVCGMGMSDRCCDMDSDILWTALVAGVAHTSRGLFACGRARVDGGRKFIAGSACSTRVRCSVESKNPTNYLDVCTTTSLTTA